jgi:hypothetical protein
MNDELQAIHNYLQPLIDRLMVVRQNANGIDKQTLSYVTKKIDIASKAIGLALDKIEGV